MDGFWYKAWQFALLFGVMTLLGVSVFIQSNSTSADEVRTILAEEGIESSSTGWPVDQSVRPELTPFSSLGAAAEAEIHHSIAPDVPPPIDRDTQRTWEIHIESIEGVCPLDPANGVTTEMWGFRIAGEHDVTCGSPGPVLRGRVGDMVSVTLTNLPTNTHPHNIDFHAVTGQGGGAADLTAAPGETKTIEVRLLYPGAFMYHCAFGDVPLHIAKGMYGMFLVDPEVSLPEVDHEWAIMQSEWYVNDPGADGEAPFNMDKLFDEEPRYVTFNGRTDALVGENSLQMAVGERARIYFVNEGLNLTSNFHPIGSHWDLVYPEAATHQANRAIRGSQSTLVVAGGGTVVEIDALVPSTIILVDHALVRTFYKGAIGLIEISGDVDPEIFDGGGAVEESGGAGGEPAGGDTGAQHGQELFAASCTACHGPAATGVAGLGPSLVGSEFVATLSDAELVDFLNEGRAADHPDNTSGVAMPAKGGNPSLTDDDLSDIAAYLRSLDG